MSVYCFSGGYYVHYDSLGIKSNNFSVFDWNIRLSVWSLFIQTDVKWIVVKSFFVSPFDTKENADTRSRSFLSIEAQGTWTTVERFSFTMATQWGSGSLWSDRVHGLRVSPFHHKQSSGLCVRDCDEFSECRGTNSKINQSVNRLVFPTMPVWIAF